MAFSDLLQATAALTFIPGIGDTTAKLLISYCGGAAEVFRASKRDLLRINGIGESTADSLLLHKNNALHRAEQELTFAEKNAIQVLPFNDKSYPYRLKNCPDSPLLLYYKGTADLQAQRMVAIVGTRRPSDYGREWCVQLLQDLVPYHTCIVSGLAYGIDQTAHSAAVKNQIPTIGVLAHGLDRLYPAAHKNLAQKMLENGGLLSDFPSQTQPDRENFPQRNRIIAGMCDLTIVVETALKGGSMITAYYAQEYNRDVAALCGRSTDIASQGCNLLIKKNIAALVENAEDIANLMMWEKDDLSSASKHTIQRPLFVDLGDEEKAIAEALQQENDTSLHIDVLAARLQWSSSTLAAKLLGMELLGLIKRMPGNLVRWVR
ncbi:MAG: DNA-protecting protein DprA [Sphingobacteriales bacterium]|nr:DNA-protecting protein DprA [Sphingobacteriales bacterium]